MGQQKHQLLFSEGRHSDSGCAAHPCSCMSTATSEVQDSSFNASGDVWTTEGLKASVAARSFKGELIVIGESRVNPFMQVWDARTV